MFPGISRTAVAAVHCLYFLSGIILLILTIVNTCKVQIDVKTASCKYQLSSNDLDNIIISLRFFDLLYAKLQEV